MIFDFQYDLRISSNLLKDPEIREMLFNKITNKELLANPCYTCLDYDDPFLQKFDWDTFYDKESIIKKIFILQIPECHNEVKKGIIYCKDLINK